MGLILDSTILVADERKRFDLTGFLKTRREPVRIAAITASELLHGCHRANSEERLRKRAAYVDWVFSQFETLPFSMEEARHHARLGSALAQNGEPIGANDLLIAATAVCFGYEVATLNRREFSRVPDLVLVEEPALLPFVRQ